jgi:hypothetical protein
MPLEQAEHTRHEDEAHRKSGSHHHGSSKDPRELKPGHFLNIHAAVRRRGLAP